MVFVNVLKDVCTALFASVKDPVTVAVGINRSFAAASSDKSYDLAL